MSHVRLFQPVGNTRREHRVGTSILTQTNNNDHKRWDTSSCGRFSFYQSLREPVTQLVTHYEQNRIIHPIWLPENE